MWWGGERDTENKGMSWKPGMSFSVLLTDKKLLLFSHNPYLLLSYYWCFPANVLKEVIMFYFSLHFPTVPKPCLSPNIELSGGKLRTPPHLLPRAVIRKHHKPGSLEQQKLIVSQFWRPEI